MRLMKLHKLLPRLTRVIALEIFVFGTFIGICAIIDALIVQIPPNPDPTLNFIIGALKVILSLILIAIWLYLWYFLTKRIMLTRDEVAQLRSEKQAKKQNKKQIKEKEKDESKT